MKNPQADFEDGVFGPNGTHPTPKTLPFPTQKIQTIFGEMTEYLIPDEQKEQVLKELHPYGAPPPLDAVLVDIHSDREFTVRDYKVVEQNGYVMPVSPYFAEDGASVIDWEPKESAESGMHIDRVPDAAVESAFRAGRADGFTGMPMGTAKPTRPEGMDEERYAMIEDAYIEGYEAGLTERDEQRMEFASLFAAGTNRRTGRRPR